ncbi:CobO [Desulfamplus magnetovallimortis]|uniref:corrinoid adenosyltransferase n=1 Tax=Desulfamplus magnetovallimortis TaxID=1246637 RepID=A0A1W1HCK0_9BACT|nr:CobO [Desulfamplus magnetovallimortis]
MQGYVQIYTGNGKGKTTAALGLILRQLGAGGKIFMGQFLKQGDYSEITMLKRFPEQITIEQFGLGKFVRGNPSDEDIEAGRKGYERIASILKNGEHNLVVMDEGNIAVFFNIISEDEMIKLFDTKADHVELVITGRGATPAMIERADLVTEMTEIKHYYQMGVKARTGIEK